MKRMKWAVVVLVVIIALVFALPAAAVTDGELDGNGHPEVVLLLMEVNGAPAFRCSATMLTPTVVLTAGHCAGAPGEFSGMRIFAESDVQHDASYPFAGGPNTYEAVSWSAHPLYPTAPFFVHDVGIVVLAEPGYNPGRFGTLPTANQLDALKPSSKTKFTAVGYGLQMSFPDAASFLEHNVRIRYVAHPHLIQINTGFTGPQSLLLSNNANTGGTCFGDSGGPNFLGDSSVVAAVTSFGINGNCAGTGGVFRIDRPDVLAFINSYLP